VRLTARLRIQLTNRQLATAAALMNFSFGTAVGASYGLFSEARSYRVRWAWDSRQCCGSRLTARDARAADIRLDSRTPVRDARPSLEVAPIYGIVISNGSILWNRGFRAFWIPRRSRSFSTLCVVTSLDPDRFITLGGMSIALLSPVAVFTLMFGGLRLSRSPGRTQTSYPGCLFADHGAGRRDERNLAPDLCGDESGEPPH
jgi:hypothetical protein